MSIRTRKPNPLIALSVYTHLIIFCLIRFFSNLFVIKTIQMIWFILTISLLLVTILSFTKKNSKNNEKIILSLMLIVFLFFCVRWNGDITDFLVSIKPFPFTNTLTTNDGNIVMLYNDTLFNQKNSNSQGPELFREYILGSNRYLRKKYKRDIVQNIKIIDLNYEQEPKNYYDKWDISKARSKSVMLWLVKNEENSEMYDMYIGAKGKIILSEGYEFFANYVNCEAIEGLENLDTHYIKDCISMFANLSKIKELDLSTFDTSNVENFIHMFKNCSSLEKLILNNFDTQHLKAAFYNCNNLKELEINGIQKKFIK